MRCTVWAEMLATTPSRANCLASSGQSHWLSDRPTPSGRSHATFTRCTATEGGKDRFAAGSFAVVQSFNAAPHKPRGPLAGVAALQAGLPLNIAKCSALREHHHRPRPPNQPGGLVRTPQNIFEFFPLLIGK
jgi:hypothetical protein